MATVEEIRQVLFDEAEEFTTVDADRLAKIDRMITRAMANHNQKSLGSDYELAVALFVADSLKSQELSKNNHSGAVNRKKSKSMEIAYSTKGFKTYGERYQEIIGRALPAAFVINGCY